MNKFNILIISMSTFLINPAFADSQCDSTWNNSSAAQSCGTVCTNPVNSHHYDFSSHYNATTNECTFNAGCCEGKPYQVCSYQSAVCDPTSITVKKDDSQFYNSYGTLKHQ